MVLGKLSGNKSYNFNCVHLLNILHNIFRSIYSIETKKCGNFIFKFKPLLNQLNLVLIYQAAIHESEKNSCGLN